MSVEVYFEPLDVARDWPGSTTLACDRRKSSYNASMQRTLDNLESEARHLGASELVLQVRCTREHLRRDGWLRSSARVDGPEVIVVVHREPAPIRVCIDKWRTWQENLRAVGLTLQRLRLIEQDGGVRDGEQYRGFEALPPADGRMTLSQAIGVLAEHAGTDAPDARDLASLKSLHRAACQRTHPDHGGDAETFGRVQAAWAVVKDEVIEGGGVS